MFANGYQALLSLFLILKLVELGGDHHVSPLVALKPFLELQILLHPPPPRIQQDKTELECLPMKEIRLDEPLPVVLVLARNFGESISWEVYEVYLVIHPEKIDDLRATGR